MNMLFELFLFRSFFMISDILPNPAGDRGEHRAGVHGQVLPAALPPLPHADAPLGRVRPLRARPPALPRGPRHAQLQQEDHQGMIGSDDVK